MSLLSRGKVIREIEKGESVGRKERKLLAVLMALIFAWTGLATASSREERRPVQTKSAICKAQASPLSFVNKCPQKFKQLIASKGQEKDLLLPDLQASVNHGERKFVSRPIPAIANKSPPAEC